MALDAKTANPCRPGLFCSSCLSTWFKLSWFLSYLPLERAFLFPLSRPLYIQHILDRFLPRVPAAVLLFSVTRVFGSGRFHQHAFEFVCLCVCVFTLSLSSLSLCLLLLSRSILLHSSSISGHGGRPCSCCSRHLSIWTPRRWLVFIFLWLKAPGFILITPGEHMRVAES